MSESEELTVAEPEVSPDEFDDSELTEAVAAAMDDLDKDLELLRIEARWAARAIAVLRLAFMGGAQEFPKGAIEVDQTTEKSINHAIRAAAKYLEHTFLARITTEQ